VITEAKAQSEHRLRDAAITLAIMPVYGAMLVWFNGGHPRSVWFYPYAVLLALALGLTVGVRGRGERQWTKGVLGPVQPFNIAAGWALVHGLGAAVTLGIFFWLSYWDRSTAFLCAMIGVYMGLMEYRYRRGLKYSIRPFLYALVFVLLLEVLLIDVFKVVARG
jgi:hypothetical protein